MDIISINILTITVLSIIILYTIFNTIKNTYRVHKQLYYYNESEKTCNKDPIELETVRYNMDLILTNENNIQSKTYRNSIIILIVSIFMSVLSYIKEYTDFIVIYVFMSIIAILIISNLTNNNYLQNNDILQYRKLKREFINALQLYLDKNNMNTILDLPPELLKSLISRYKIIYDINNESNEYASLISNEYEILSKMISEFDKINNKNKKYIDATELFKYLKLHYDVSKPVYKSDIEYLIKQDLNKDIFEIINEYFWDNEELLKIMKQKYLNIEDKIAKIKPFLKDVYKNSIYIYFDDKGNKTSKPLKGKEKYYNYVTEIIITNDILLNKNIEEIIESKHLKNNTLLNILYKEYNNISEKCKDLRPYLKIEYQKAINQYTGKAEVNKGNIYSYITKVILSNDKLIGNNDMNVFYNLSLSKYNPYNSLNKSFMNILTLQWIYLSIIFYFIFHMLYSSYLSNSKYLIQFICIFILMSLMLIMILPITWNI
jgi:hypothetical protein